MAAALLGIPYKFNAERKEEKMVWRKKIVVLESISALLQRETLYFIGQKYAMWPPLSSKGLWENREGLLFFSSVIDEDKGLFWRTHPMVSATGMIA